MPYEYARFGQGFIRRTVKDEYGGSPGDWFSCARDDVPQSFFDEETKARIRRESIAAGGGDPFRDDVALPQGAVVMNTGASKAQAVRMPNPEVDAVAAELGLSGQELRDRLTTAPGGTRQRVSEERFDEIAGKLGISPTEARARFADESLELPSNADELDFR